MGVYIFIYAQDKRKIKVKGDIRIATGEIEALPEVPEFIKGKSAKHRMIYVMLKELLESERVNQLFRDFYEMVGVPVAIIDLGANVLASSRWQRICTTFHRANPGTCARCIESDTELANDLESGSEFTIYDCKNGMTDCASPIIIEGEHVANLFIGQFLRKQPDSGMNDHIGKPISVHEMFSTMARWITPAKPADPVEQPVAPSEAESDADALPPLAGIDVELALSRIDGNTRSYRKLLERFRDNQAGAAQQVTNAMEEGDWELATRLAHTLKGVAGNVGAQEVHAAKEGELGAVATVTKPVDANALLSLINRCFIDYR